jgi:hypothetical protein
MVKVKRGWRQTDPKESRLSVFEASKMHDNKLELRSRFVARFLLLNKVITKPLVILTSDIDMTT